MSTTSHYIIEHDRNWTWLQFPNWDVNSTDDLSVKTQDEIKAAIKRVFRFHWARSKRMWYAKRRIPEQQIRQVIEEARQNVMGDIQTESNAYDYIPASQNVPKLYEQDGEKDPIVHVKLFGGSSFTWLITEYSPDQDLAFGFACLGDLEMAELGYISIAELRELKFPPFSTRVERDIWWQPMKLSEAKKREWPSFFGDEEPIPVNEPEEDPEATYKLAASSCKKAFLDVFSRLDNQWGYAATVPVTLVYNQLMQDKPFLEANRDVTFFDKRTLAQITEKHVEMYGWYLDTKGSSKPHDWLFRRLQPSELQSSRSAKIPSGFSADTAKTGDECRQASPKEAMGAATAKNGGASAKAPALFQTVRWADGLSVYCPVIVPDDDNETVVMMQMIGPAESVKANWAAIMNGGNVRYINGCKVDLTGMKEHVRLEKNLPCGYRELWLIHKQASFTEMTPAAPVFFVTNLLAENQTSLPYSDFYRMLDKALSIPLLAEWAEFLWQAGSVERLLWEIPKSHCFGTRAWKVLTDADRWGEIVSNGLANGRIRF
ncbi:MAG: DUF2958 domain-containing protein [Ardenticatenaceae bacterium]|nr:DUF2958 domain-containing protein [Ardenticatenaceae bacterium]